MGSFLFLGTGSSTGAPLIGCTCPVCKSSSLKNRRLRPSGLLTVGDKKILIDVGPDFRQQALNAGLDRLDGLVLTHTHYDHIAGIDELRTFYLRSRKPLPCLLSVESFEDLKKRYYYFFSPIGEATTLTAQLSFTLLEDEIGQTSFLGLPFSHFSYAQGGMGVTGYRIGDFAYVTDIRDFDPSIFLSLEGIRYLVLGALHEEPSPSHFHFEEAFSFAKKTGAEKTWLTHLSHRVDYEETHKMLPPGIFLGYDGLEIFFHENW